MTAAVQAEVRRRRDAGGLLADIARELREAGIADLGGPLGVADVYSRHNRADVIP